MKRLTAFLLICAIVFGLCGCKKEVKINAVTPQKVEGVYQLKEPGHVVFMQNNPGEDYALVNDIDMQGLKWKSVDEFSGNLTGLAGGVYNYAISNLILEPTKEDETYGIFRKVSGNISDITFKNITVQSEDVFTGDLGVVAGECHTALVDVDVTDVVMKLTVSNSNVGVLCGVTMGNVENCYTSGNMELVLKGGKGQVGGMIGCAEQAVTKAESRVDMNITTKVSTAGGVGGVVGYGVGEMTGLNYGGKFTLTAGAEMAAAPLVGHLEGKLTDSLSCARITKITNASSKTDYYGSKSSSATVTGCHSRDTTNLDEFVLSDVEYAMRKKVVDYMYEECTIRWVPVKTMTYSDECASGHPQTYEAGKAYFGLPYVHSCGSLERMKAFLNKDGTLSDKIPAENWNVFLGNDCADAVYWAWAQVSSQITYTLTNNMICVNGTVPVGGYEVTDTGSTAKIIQDNGPEVMYEAYAKLKMGDGILFAPGHVRMVAEAAYVFRNEDGIIDPDLSYVLFHEQGTTMDVAVSSSTCKVNGKVTFSKLLKTNYIPITVEAFANGKADAPEITCTNTDYSVNGLCKGMIKSNYRLNWVRVRILDEKGKEVVSKTEYPCGGDHVTVYGLSMMKSAITSVSLKSGNKYTYEVLVGAAGEDVSVQKFEFKA